MRSVAPFGKNLSGTRGEEGNGPRTSVKVLLVITVPYNVDAVSAFLFVFSVEGLGDITDEVDQELEGVGGVVDVPAWPKQLFSVVGATRIRTTKYTHTSATKMDFDSASRSNITYIALTTHAPFPLQSLSKSTLHSNGGLSRASI